MIKHVISSLTTEIKMTTIRYHYTPNRMAKIKKKNSKVSNAGKDAEKLNYTYIACRNVKCYNHSEKLVNNFLPTKHLLRYNSATVLHDFDPKKMK